MIEFLISKIKECPEFAIGGLVGGMALYGSLAWPEFGNPLTFVCIASVYAMLSRGTGLDHTVKSLARAVPASVVVAFVVVAAAIFLGELFADSIRSDGRQGMHLILLISATGLIVSVPPFLAILVMHEVAKSQKGRWLAWHIRSREQKIFVADCTFVSFLICVAIDVSIRSTF